ncbi:CAP domain-containing protein [Solwaraspora sp. WMMD406]|uniref:CAP domain-containing protein n=1 Tax=Solwaraspora sp. WMMD406 TaxID=3016095 RepID=UPI002417B650|nr:CAP domain-containing protein [Solwaraspora sp. WMMD406]MDG4767228.1 CAP domain-containing protein [Solwaraspora sp. WMMD406]
MYRRIDPGDDSAQGRTSPSPTDQRLPGTGGDRPGDDGGWDTRSLGQTSWRDHLDAGWRGPDGQRGHDPAQLDENQHLGHDQHPYPDQHPHVTHLGPEPTGEAWPAEWPDTPGWLAADAAEDTARHPAEGDHAESHDGHDGHPDHDPDTAALTPAVPSGAADTSRAARRRAARLAGEPTSSRTGRPGDRRRFAPGPIALATLVAVLLVAIGGGVAMMRAGLADGSGDGTGPATVAADDTRAPTTDETDGGDGEPEIGEPEVLGVELGPAPTPSPTPAPSTAAPTPAAPDRDASERPAPDPTTPTPSRPTTAAPGGAGPAPTAAGGGDDVEQQVLAIVNAERSANGCGEVVVNSRLSEASRLHSEDQAATDTMSHTGSDGSDPWQRAQRAGYQRAIGENVAAGYPTAQAVMDGWMNSQGHRANILNCEAVSMGVGTAKAADGTLYWTQMFGAVA